jgi:hypothetical protein
MIVAAGLGTRLRPLTELRPKPALPLRGIPLVGYTLALLRHHGVDEVVINTHHLPEQLEAAARAECPDGLRLRFSREETLLDTGGGIRRVADFLRESDPCLIVGGDMLIDVDLGALLREHREQRSGVTMLLREDPREASFGGVGVAAHLRRASVARDLQPLRGLVVAADPIRCSRPARLFPAVPLGARWYAARISGREPGAAALPVARRRRARAFARRALRLGVRDRRWRLARRRS